MENKTALERLDEKIGHLLQKCEELKNENEMMRNEVVTLKAEAEIRDAEIDKLLDENSKKDIEIEEIVNKIESILS